MQMKIEFALRSIPLLFDFCKFLCRLYNFFQHCRGDSMILHRAKAIRAMIIQNLQVDIIMDFYCPPPPLPSKSHSWNYIGKYITGNTFWLIFHNQSTNTFYFLITILYIYMGKWTVYKGVICSYWNYLSVVHILI